MPTLEGVVLRDGSEIKFRGILWNVTLHPEPETARDGLSRPTSHDRAVKRYQFRTRLTRPHTT